MIDITIAVISYGGLYRLEHCIRSIVDCTKDSEINRELIFLDDGSRSEHRKNADEIYSWASKTANFPVTLIVHDNNKGITRSWNRVTQEAEGKYIALLNDDILVAPKWLDIGYYFMKNNPTAGMVGFPTWFCRKEDMPNFFQANYYLNPRSPHGSKPHIPITEVDDYNNREKYNVPGRCACPVGCCFMYSKENWSKIQYKDGSVGFPEWLKSLYEDFTFAYEMMKLGKRNYMLRYPKLYHCLGDTFSSSAQELNRNNSQLLESRQRFIDYYGGDERQVMDTFYENQKKNQEPIMINFLDGYQHQRSEKEAN